MTYEVHLILDCHDNGSNMLCGIPDNRDEDQTNEVTAQASSVDQCVYAVDKVVGTDRNKNSCHDKYTGSSPGVHVCLLILVRLFLGRRGDRTGGRLLLNILSSSLGTEKVVVSAQLEPEVQDVEEQHEDRCAAREV